MNLLSLSKVNMSFGERSLFSDVSFSVYENEKIGFVGSNGAGKTTLFKIMTGEISPASGEIFKNRELKIGYLRQHMDYSSKKTLYDEVLSAFSHLLKMESALDEANLAVEKDPSDENLLRQMKLNDEYIKKGGLTYKNITKSSLLGLGFKEEELFSDFASLSGGQKTRAMLCKILLSDANLLLLDEPTNHLDIKATEWLENFLLSYQGSVIIISHDRYFLDKVTSRTFELSAKRFYEYKGNYSVYLKLKAERELTLEREYENTTREIDRIYGIVEQQRRWNRERNIKTAESKLKQIDRLKEDLVAPEARQKQLKFSVSAKKTSGNDVLDVEGILKSFGNKQVLSGVSFKLYKNNSAFLLGANGCGKTTLFKIITENLEKDAGKVRYGANVEIAYYDQAQQNLDYTKTIFDEIHDEYPDMTHTAVRSALAAFLFFGDDVFSEISNLSGGERARVSLLKMMLKGANLLILDEPTNHLDIASREALEQALLGYDGTILAVSHDRYFINKLADRIFFMESGRLNIFEGNYDYFLEKTKTQNQENKAEIAPKKTSGELYREQKQKEAEMRKKENEIKRLEDEIAKTEEELAELNNKLCDDDVATDYAKAAQISEEIAKLDAHLDELMTKWDSLTM